MKTNRKFCVLLVSLTLGLPVIGDEALRVAVEKLALRSQANGLSAANGSAELKDGVKVLGEYVVAPTWSGKDVKTPSLSVLPHWLKVEANGALGFVPEGTLAHDFAIQAALGDMGKMTEHAGRVTKGFSEVEDDVALSTMKGAAGRNKIGKMTAADKLNAVVLPGTPDVADVRRFLSEGELEAVAFPVRPASTEEARIPKIMQQGGVDPKMIAKFKKLKELTKDSKDPEIKMAMKAMQAMINKSFEDLDPVREHAIGEYVAARFVAQHKVVAPDASASVYVRTLGRALSTAANGPSCYAPCQFIVLNAPSVTNACAIAGGYIFVMSGLLDFVQDEDELACVLAHELAHVELHHGIRAVGSGAMMQLFSAVADYALADEKKTDADFANALDLVFKYMTQAVENGYGAELESEADWRGVQIAARLGYDTRAMAETFRRLKRINGSAGGSGYPKNRVEDAVSYCSGFGFDRIQTGGRAQRKIRFGKFLRR